MDTQKTEEASDFSCGSERSLSEPEELSFEERLKRLNEELESTDTYLQNLKAKGDKDREGIKEVL